MQKISASERDIGSIPAVVNPARRDSCRLNFQLFCEIYLPLTFYLRLSDNQKTEMRTMQEAAINGGLFVYADPRGDGKTSRAEALCLWVMLYGHRNFIALIGSDEEHALGMMESLKTEIESNDFLAEDFPEVCYPVHKLDGISHRCRGQTYTDTTGKVIRTQITWSAKEMVLPTIPESKAAGARVKCAGITGRIRGLKHKRSDGKTARPDFVIVEDPQTDESSKSPSQVQQRIAIFNKAILGLAGPDKKIAGFMPCTVIEQDDMADQMLDRNKYPELQGVRHSMMPKFPTNEKLWQEYKRVRDDGMRLEDGGKAGTEFYRANRPAMDEGAEVSWAERFNHDELSAIQHAMNLFFRDEDSFWSEYQNAPRKKDIESAMIKREHVLKKTNGMLAGTPPIWCDTLTAHIDVSGEMIWWAVAGWSNEFSGALIKYGAFPEQGRRYFTLADAKRTLGREFKGTGKEGAIYAGLEAVSELILAREWLREDGAPLRVELCGVDANWSAPTIYQFCRASKYAANLYPCHGVYIGPSKAPLDTPRFIKAGERAGPGWKLVKGRRALRHLLLDANHWKSFVRDRFATAMGDPGSMTVHTGADHEMLADHLTAEKPRKIEGKGRLVEEWSTTPNRDNHFLDVLYNCAALASMRGVKLRLKAKLPTERKEEQKPRVKRERVSYLNI